jgi:hypothetical protein
MMYPLRRGRSEPKVGQGGDSSEVEAESEPWGRARRRPSSEVEVESEPWGRARRRPSSEVEVESKPWGRARRSFLWCPRLDLAAVSLTLEGGTAVGAVQVTLFSCQVSQWRGKMTAVTSALSTEECASGSEFSGGYVDVVNGLVGAGFTRAAPEPLHRARGWSRTDLAFIIRPFVAFPQGGGGKAPCCPQRAPNMVSPVSC